MLKKISDYILYGAVRGTLGLINFVPLPLRLKGVELLIRTVTTFIPRYRAIARRNLDIAYPDKDESWKNELVSSTHTSLARLVVDSARLPLLNEDWVRSHVEFPREEEFRALKERYSGKGLVVATGHLGSFELLAHSAALYGYPLSYVVRNFKSERVDRWWIGVREASGNRVIARKGAYREILRQLRQGRDVGILFDQNVRRGHAVFVDLFGLPAATTRAVALSALQTGVPVVVASVRFLGDERYRIEWLVCEFTEIYSATELSRAEKVERITQEITQQYEQMIRATPHEWFWMHRRWKTRPSEEDDPIYVS